MLCVMPKTISERLESHTLYIIYISKCPLFTLERGYVRRAIGRDVLRPGSDGEVGTVTMVSKFGTVTKRRER